MDPSLDRNECRADTFRAAAWVLRPRAHCVGDSETGATRPRRRWLAAAVHGVFVGTAGGWVAGLVAIVAGRLGVASSQPVLFAASMGGAAIGACAAVVLAWRARTADVAPEYRARPPHWVVERDFERRSDTAARQPVRCDEP